MAKGREVFMLGNLAAAEGAIAAGCRFFGGYPITPSTEIAEEMSRRMPLLNGVFIQMEDEIASIASVIGASAAGMKAMTATSGPGFSLMQENIGFAYMTELPLVIVNVQRGGPSTGLPTMVSQSDTMQARWGTHGDFTSITLTPSTVEEAYLFTKRAFKLAEKYSTPVFVLMDEVLGHMREKFFLPDEEEVVETNRIFPNVPPEWYHPYEMTANYVTHPAPFGAGFRYHITGLTHDRDGFPTAKSEEIVQKLNKLRMKIEMHRKDIIDYDLICMDDALYAIVAYGTAARAAKAAVKELRDNGVRVGLFHMKTVWPFPDKEIKEMADVVRAIIVPELNMGQVVREVRRAAGSRAHIHSLTRYDGRLLTPQEILDKVLEVRSWKS